MPGFEDVLEVDVVGGSKPLSLALSLSLSLPPDPPIDVGDDEAIRVLSSIVKPPSSHNLEFTLGPLSKHIC